MTTLKHLRAQIAALCVRIAAQVPSNAFGTLAKIQAFRENPTPLSGRRLADALRKHGRPDLAAEVEALVSDVGQDTPLGELLPDDTVAEFATEFGVTPEEVRSSYWDSRNSYVSFELPPSPVGRLRKLRHGRWAIIRPGLPAIEITSGEVFRVEVEGMEGLQPTRMEYVHPGGYYAVDGYPLRDGLRAALGTGED